MNKMTMVAMVLLLAGCGGGSDGPDPTPPPAPEPEPEARALLVPVGSEEAFDEWLRSGLEQWAGLTNDTESVRRALETPLGADVRSQPDVLENAAVDFAAFGDAGTSRLNVIVEGVDELDAARYDGDHIYLANSDRLQVIETTPGADSELVATLRVTEDRLSASRGLYHLKDASRSRLVNIRSQSYGYWAFDYFAPWYWDNESHIDMIDVDVPEAPVVSEQISIDGSYVNSRRIGDTLYLISRYSPDLGEVVPFAESEDEKARNQEIIDALDTETLLPKIRFGDGTEAPLVTSDRCFLPNADEATGTAIRFPTITTITAIDITAPTSFESLCMAEGVAGVHVSLNAIYIAAFKPRFEEDGSYYDHTMIHKIAIDGDAPAYRGSGELTGTFWGDPAFLMGEHEGRLTAVTTTFDEDSLRHHLTVLGEAGDFELETLGQIPNDDRPAAIGKPGEQIYASRIVGDRAFIVTFQQIDPVYVIDLSTPADPQILGELEIPGFSTYLHPISDDLLLGIGKDVELVDGAAFPQGVNVRLFDVGEPTVPTLLNEVSIGKRGTETPVNWDLHALTALEVDGTWRFALPLRVHGDHVEARDPSSWMPWTENALYLFEVDPNEKALRATGRIVAEDQLTGQRYQPGCCTWGSRSFMKGDAVYFLEKTRLIQASWQDPKPIERFFIPSIFVNPEDEVGTLEARDGLRVSLFDYATGDYLGCGYALAIDGEFEAQLRTCGEDRDAGLFERPGSYSVQVEKEEYETWTTGDVRVQQDATHVGTTWLDVFLER